MSALQLEAGQLARPTLLDDYLTEPELAVELKLAAITLTKWRLAKIGPPVTRMGKKVLYRRSSVRQWLASQERGAS
jgi:hypothetical protein